MSFMKLIYYQHPCFMYITLIRGTDLIKKYQAYRALQSRDYLCVHVVHSAHYLLDQCRRLFQMIIQQNVNSDNNGDDTIRGRGMRSHTRSQAIK